MASSEAEGREFPGGGRSEKRFSRAGPHSQFLAATFQAMAPATTPTTPGVTHAACTCTPTARSHACPRPPPGHTDVRERRLVFPGPGGWRSAPPGAARASGRAACRPASCPAVGVAEAGCRESCNSPRVCAGWAAGLGRDPRREQQPCRPFVDGFHAGEQYSRG